MCFPACSHAKQQTFYVDSPTSILFRSPCQFLDSKHSSLGGEWLNTGSQGPILGENACWWIRLVICWKFSINVIYVMDQLVREFVLQMYVWPFVCSKTHIVACFMYRVMKIKMQWHIMNPEQKCIYSQFSSTGIAIYIETLCSLCFCIFSHVCFSNNATCNAFCNAHVVLWNTAFELSTEVILEVAFSKGKSPEPGKNHMASHSYRNHYPWRIHGTGPVYLPTFSH